MKNIVRAGITAVVLSLGLAAPSAAGPFEDGLAAYGRGDYSTAIQLWRPLADQGNVLAQTNLGFMYENGSGVQQDDVAAVSWYQKAANQGDSHAQNNLGFMYQRGRGVAHDDAAAVSWYQKAADQGDALEHFSIRLGVARVCEISFAFFFGNPFEKRGDCSPKLLNSTRLHFA
jgi:TPR repeat protein